MKKKKLPSLVSILILTLITVFFWVAFDVYRLFTKPQDPVVPESVSLPLNPTLDQEVLNQLKQTVFLEDSEIGDLVTSPSNTNNSTETPVPESSPSATQSPEESPES
jgi:hypothetical protein